MARVWLALAVVLVGVAVAAVLNASAEDDSPDLTPEELGARLARTLQIDLGDAQREQELNGRIRVVRVDCVNELHPRFICLAHTAATGASRRLVAPAITITGRHGGGGGWVVRSPWPPRP